MISFLLFLWLQAHAFHISRTEINYNVEQSSVQMTLSIFIDDLESALDKRGIKSPYLGTDKENAKGDQWITEYLKENLVLKSKGAVLEWNYLGKEHSDDKIAFWIYLEAENVVGLENLFVSNKVLIEIFDDQKNIVSIKRSRKQMDMHVFDVKSKEKSFSLQ